MKTNFRLLKRAKGYAMLLFLLIAFFTKPHAAMAQKAADTCKPMKYELSIDLVPLIDNGQFGKVYFKIHYFKDKKLKGAFRIGASEGTYWFSKYLPNPITTTSFDMYHNFSAEVFLGYEEYRTVGCFMTYYGFDVSGRYFIRVYDPHYSDDNQVYTVGFCPFVGIKKHISKKMTVAFEIGLENTFSIHKDLDPRYNGLTSHDFHSDLRLPYNFTFNYHF